MSINLKDVQRKLNELKEKEASSSNAHLYWKPEEGDNIIRIVPYQHNTEWPFIEVYTHYEFSKLAKLKNYLVSPKTLGDPDPLVEWANTLKKTGVKEDYILSRKFEPTQRIHVPIIVRGKEDEGVKFYGFGIRTYEDLLAIINDADYGDITSLKDGRDVVITYTPKDKSSTKYAETKLRIKPNQTPAVITKEHVELLKQQPNLIESLTITSYDELKNHLAEFLNPSEDETINNSDFDDITSATETNNTVETSTDKVNDSDKSIKKQLDDLFAD